ncbi:MAG: sugar ABC transporter permease [Ardenticatenaceae bacterium]|nr:sugar ABC transporter permease [Anaerolineales bacterium]MCB8940456.1 sugar ABC transporter permease [Ardenticatenaceae bacterium]MCB8973472.1 sugar ABC transporter permease [Ardenticatenaceae bacterium]
MSLQLVMKTIRRHESARVGLLLVAPALVILLVFQVLPVFYTLRLSMAEGPGFQTTGFVGLENYNRLFTDLKFLNLASFPPKGALMTSIQWMVFAVPSVILIGLVVALAADRSRFESLIRGAFFLPMVISGTVIGIIWLFMFAPNPDVGLLNAMTGGTQSWLGNPSTVNPALMGAWVWGQTGMSVVIIAAALKGISVDMIEAARVDGANGWQLFWRITLPSIRTPLAFLLTTQMVQVLKVFDVVFVMTGGGPAGLSRTLAVFFYEQTFVSLNPQYAAAIVVIMSLLILLAFRITRKVGEEDSND